MNEWHISRRRMLKGLGASMALPFLEAMIPPGLTAAPRDLSAKRAAFLYMPNGVHPDRWTPEGIGTKFELSPILKPLESLRDDLLIFTNLMNKNSDTRIDGHFTKTANWLTSMQVNNTMDANVSGGGISLDQLMAQKIGKNNAFPSLVYGMDRMKSGVARSVGLTALYASVMSWKTPTQPCTREIDPRVAFDRLFRGLVPGKDVKPESPHKESVLDAVMEDARSLNRRLGADDQNKLAEYLEAVRTVEERIGDQERQRKFEDRLTPEIKQELLHTDRRIDEFLEDEEGIDVTERMRLMMDIIVLAFWSDTSRVATFMMGDAVSNRNFSFLPGVDGSHHAISHHANDPRQMERYATISHWHIEQYAYMLNRMKSIKEGDSNLLDNSIVMFGSGLRDGNRHSCKNVPVVVAGKAGGALRTGQHLMYPEETPLANLYRSMLVAMDCGSIPFGDSKADMTEILA